MYKIKYITKTGIQWKTIVADSLGHAISISEAIARKKRWQVVTILEGMFND